MKNFNYKGKNIRPQRVKVRKGPKIEEVLKDDQGTTRDSDFLNNRNLAKEINKQINENAQTPNWNFLIIRNETVDPVEFQKILINPNAYLNRKFTLKEFEENENSDFLFFDNSNANPKYGFGLMYLIELNLLAKSTGINLNISDDGFILTCGAIYKLLISLPFKIDSKNTFSYFDSKSRFLYVFLSFYKDDIILYKNEKFNSLNNIKQTNSDSSNSHALSNNYCYNEIVKIDDLIGDSSLNDIDAIKTNSLSHNSGIDSLNEVKENNQNQNKLEEIKSKITDDYLYDVII